MRDIWILAFILLMIITLFAGSIHFKLDKKQNEYTIQRNKKYLDTLDTNEMLSVAYE